MSVLTDALSSTSDEKVTLTLCVQGHEIKTSPKNEPKNQAMLPFSLNVELLIHTTAASQNVLPVYDFHDFQWLSG